MIKNYIENANFEDTGFAYTLSLISGKHKMVILYCLMEFETVRFNELKRYLKTISDKTLSTNLKELEADKLIVRTEYPQIPPKVEYALSDRGKSLMTVLDQLCVWGEENRLTEWQIQVCRIQKFNMKCEIERMEIIYTFYFFAFFEKVIKKLLTFCYW